MSQLTLPKAHEILSVIDHLEEELRELDRLGAGIAAIHVNAAIEQLRSNLETMNKRSAVPSQPPLLYLVSAQAAP